jgi:acetyl/propionyl-CoA carboxylase alpha subunit
VREQIRVAGGSPLSFGQSGLRQVGHSLECRIYAEVAEENFRPSTGVVEVFRPPSGPGIRLDSGIQQGSTVSYHFDPMLAKLIVWAPARGAAIERMKRALEDFVLLGVQHNIEFLHRVISTADFAEGRLDTHFLERHAGLFQPPAHIPDEVLLAASLLPALADSAAGARAGGGSAAFADVWNSGPWRNA